MLVLVCRWAIPCAGIGSPHCSRGSYRNPIARRSKRNRENTYLLDRQVQKTESFTGIEGVNTQDRAVQESMGRMVDRSREHLGPADTAIVQARRLLLQAVNTVQEGGTPHGINPTYYTVRAEEGVLPRAANWRDRFAPETSAVEILQTV